MHRLFAGTLETSHSKSMNSFRTNILSKVYENSALQISRDVVLSAVQQDSRALQYVSRKDRENIIAVVC